MASGETGAITSETESISFQLDRFDLDADKRLEVRGRWFGVRGRRFVRPTLTIMVGGEKRRALADLEHKPWTPEDGEEWVASFPQRAELAAADQIELAVAPDVAIALPVPGAGATAAAKKRPAGGTDAPVRRALERERARASDLQRELDRTQEAYAQIAQERNTVIGEQQSLRREHAALRRRVTELETQLSAAEASANARVAEAEKELHAQRAETDRLRDAVGQRDAIAAERDRLASELEAAVAERSRLAASAESAPPDPRPALHDRQPPQRDPQPPPPRPPARPSRPPARDPRPPRRDVALVWATRALAVIALCGVLVAFVLVLRSA